MSRLRWASHRFWWLPILVLYAGVVFFTIAHHEPWFDEAQAWLIARDCTPWYMLSHVIRYEGTPGLWHLILSFPARYGFPYVTERLLGGTIASAGVLLFLMRSPFPRVIAAILPFTYFLCFQYAVVARNYVLFPPLLFAIAATYHSRIKRPFLFLGLNSLLANVSTHGLLIATSIIGLYLWDTRHVWQRSPRRDRIRLLAAVAVFLTAAGFAVWQIWPAKDYSITLGFQQTLANRLVFAAERMSGAWTDNWAATLLVLIPCCIWFWETGTTRVFLVTTLPLFLLFTFVYCWYHHEGIVFLVWVFSLWISFDADRSHSRSKLTPLWHKWQRTSVLLTISLVLILHTYWAYTSIRRDLMENYSGSRDLASYLKAAHLDSKVILIDNIFPVASLPYFDRNIFRNFDNGHGSSFAFWSQSLFHTNGSLCLPFPFREEGDVLIFGVKKPPLSELPWEDPDFVLKLSPRYHFAGYFGGNLFWKTRIDEREGFAVFVRTELLKGISLKPSDNTPDRLTHFFDVESYPSKVRSSRNLAETHLMLGNLLRIIQPETAQQHYALAIQLWSGCADAYVNLGAMLAHESPSIAVKHYLRALDLNPSNASAWCNLGNILFRANAMQKAVECYQRAIEVDPRCTAARNNLARALNILRAPSSRSPD